jgi:hypothetical protein
MDSCGRICAQIRKQCPITLHNIMDMRVQIGHNPVLILCPVFLKQNTLNLCIVMCIIHSGYAVIQFLYAFLELCMKLMHIGPVVSVCIFQLENYFTGFHEILY